MNSDPNSDSEQCTESKLGRVHSAHTHGLGCAQAVRALRPGRSHNAVSWRAVASCRGCPQSCRMPCRKLCRRSCSALTLPCCHPFQSRYKNCITTQAYAVRHVERAVAHIAAPLCSVATPLCRVATPLCRVAAPLCRIAGRCCAFIAACIAAHIATQRPPPATI